jgi:hypothetical protein
MKKLFMLVFIIGMLLLSGCGSETSSTEKVNTEPAAPKTEITATGMGDTTIVVSPSVDKTIKGTVTIDLTKVLSNTKIAAFGVTKQGEEGLGTPVFDREGSDGWSYILDTTTYPNGVYTISGITGDELEDDGPDGFVQVQAIIEN